MIIINPSNQGRRTMYAWVEGGEFMLSPFATAINGYRPIQRYDNKMDLENDVRNKGNLLEWLNN